MKMVKANKIDQLLINMQTSGANRKQVSGPAKYKRLGKIIKFTYIFTFFLLLFTGKSSHIEANYKQVKRICILKARKYVQEQHTTHTKQKTRIIKKCALVTF